MLPTCVCLYMFTCVQVHMYAHVCSLCVDTKVNIGCLYRFPPTEVMDGPPENGGHLLNC